jgi:hypothetical protein
MVLALKTGKANAQDTAEAVGSLEMALRLGKITPRTIGRLINAPGLGLFLADQMKVGIEEARARLKKMNVKDLIETLAKPSDTLNERVSKLPFTISRAFAMIKNDITEAAAAIMKLTVGFGGVGKILWSTFSFAKGVVTGLVKELGGLKSTIELVGIALAIALGPIVLRQALLLTASFIEMAVASWAVWLPWIAIGAAILAAALMVQDIMIWMRNPNSKTVMGDLLGPFEEVKKKFDEFAPVKAFNAIKDIFQGDFSKGFTTLWGLLTDTDTRTTLLITTIGGVVAAFGLWKVIEFTGLLSALSRVVDAVAGVKNEVIATKNIAEGKSPTATPTTGAGTTGTGTTGTGTTIVPSTAETVAPGNPRLRRNVQRAGAIMSLTAIAADLAENTGVMKSGMKERLDAAAQYAGLGMLIGSFVPVIGTGIGGGIGAALGFTQPEIERLLKSVPQTPEDQKQRILGPVAPLSTSPSNMPTFDDPIPVLPVTPPGAQAPSSPSPNADPIGPIVPWGTTSLTPQVSPFNAVGPQAVENTVNAGGINPIYNITVTAQMDEAQVAAAVQRSVTSQTPDLLDKVSRQISDAIPRTEKATG